MKRISAQDVRRLTIGTSVDLVSKDKRTTYSIVQYGRTKALKRADTIKTIRTYKGIYYEVAE